MNLMISFRKVLLLASASVLGQGICAQTANGYAWEGHDLSVAPDSPVFYNGGVPTDDNTLYLYNVGASKDRNGLRTFFNAAGHWGVEGATFEIGIPVYIKSTYTKAALQPICEILTSPDPSESVQNRLAWIQDGVKNEDAKGIFTDRLTEKGELEKSKITAVSEWQFSPVRGMKNVYWICRNLKRTRWAYLCHPGDFPEWRHDVITAREGKDVQWSENSQWILVSRRDLINNFEKTPADYNHIADATFYIENQNFSRNSGHKDAWQLEAEGGAKVRIGNLYDQEQGDDYSYVMGTSPLDEHYSDVPTGEKNYYNLLYGQFFNAEIRGGKGVIKQTTRTIGKAGWYMVTCQGFYRPGDGSSSYNAYLYAKTSRQGATLNSDAWAKAKLPLWNSIPAQPKDMTESGMAFCKNWENYSAKVIVWLNENESIELGATVEGVSGNPSEDWMAVDNFQLKYLGEEFPVLETFGDRGAYDYYGDQTFTTMELLRTFQLGKWNSFMIPVTMNKDQVLTAFGADVRLAKLKGLDNDGNNIAFESVDLSKLSWTEDAIVKNEPYLIMPFNEGRIFPIEWGKIRTHEGVYTTVGPHYVVPAASIKVSDINDNSEVSFRTAKGETITLKPNYYWRVKQPDGSGGIQAGEDTYTYVMNKGALTRYKKPFGLKGTRWYLEYSEAPSAGAKLSVMDRSYVGTTSGIDVLPLADPTSAPRRHKGVFSLDGRKIADSNSAEGLPAGFYVIDGKKVAVY
ncbi:MAG: hypothetical protein K6A82_01525 [Prevotella sp.]|nr:hypothetical protein [Prevotella sp.]